MVAVPQGRIKTGIGCLPQSGRRRSAPLKAGVILGCHRGRLYRSDGVPSRWRRKLKRGRMKQAKLLAADSSSSAVRSETIEPSRSERRQAYIPRPLP